MTLQVRSHIKHAYESKEIVPQAQRQLDIACSYADEALEGYLQDFDNMKAFAVAGKHDKDKHEEIRVPDVMSRTARGTLR